MHALIVDVTELGCAGVDIGDEVVEERGLADSTVAGKESDLAGEFVKELVDALSCLDRDRKDGIADGAIEVGEIVGILLLLSIVEVNLVDDQDGRHVVGLGCGQESIDEGGRGLWMADGHHEQDEIEVGGQDMGLLGEVD